MTPEQFFPTRWILNGIPSREVFAEHLRKLPTLKLRKRCVYHAHYLSVYPLKKLNHKFCSASTGIHEDPNADGSPDNPWGLTYGQGGLDKNGYWLKPCSVCARKAEIEHKVPVNSYYPWERKS